MPSTDKAKRAAHAKARRERRATAKAETKALYEASEEGIAERARTEAERVAHRKAYHRNKFDNRDKDATNARRRLWESENRERLRVKNNERALTKKLDVIALFGGKCACCGIDNPDFLTIDHVKGGGTKERQIDKRKSWRVAEVEGNTGRLRLLCMNCNQSCHTNGGTCHHQGGSQPEPATSNTAYNRRARIKAIGGLGGACQCCGETGLPFLCVDHVHNDGAQERVGLYQIVIASGFDPARYQVLCFNCNLAKMIHGGVACGCT